MTAKDQYHHFSKQLAAVYEIGEAAEITDWVFESVALIKKQQLIV